MAITRACRICIHQCFGDHWEQNTCKRLHLSVFDLRNVLALQSMRSAMCATRDLMTGHARRCFPKPTQSRTGRTPGARQADSVGKGLRRAAHRRIVACSQCMHCRAPRCRLRQRQLQVHASVQLALAGRVLRQAAHRCMKGRQSGAEAGAPVEGQGCTVTYLWTAARRKPFKGSFRPALGTCMPCPDVQGCRLNI